MERNGAENIWRQGDITGLSGSQVLDTIRNGKFWMDIQKIGARDRRYQDLMDEMFEEFEERIPGLQTFKRQINILISSPNAEVFYHCDIPGQSLWQLRGEKRVYLYPAEYPFLQQKAMERIVLGETEEEGVEYKPWFDEQAHIIDLKPGEMLAWPLNAPHRVQNKNVLNVSIAAQHWTSDIRNMYAVNYGNGILRNRFGFSNLSQNTTGAAFLAKLGLATVYKFGGFQRSNQVKYEIDFKLDPQRPGGLMTIPAFELSKA